jgi:oligopeptidase A
MGHALHHLFSTVSEYSLSGINGVAWDAVEFPSQFLENFAYEKEILGRFAFHYRTGEKMPEELILKIKSSKNFHSALGLLRQVEFSLFDMLIHTSLYDEDGVAKVLEEVRRKIAVITPPSYNRFQNGFSHIFSGGYAAGYYSYKWAEVLSADAFFECLDENGNFDTQKALGYRKYILERGGSEDMSILYREWLGREPSTDSLLKLYDIHENGEMDES